MSRKSDYILYTCVYKGEIKKRKVGRGWPVSLAQWSGHPEEARPPERGTLCGVLRRARTRSCGASSTHK